MGLLEKHITGLITLSVPGNDIGFTTVLKACVFFPLQDCPGALANARDLLYAETLFNIYMGLIGDIVAVIAPMYYTTIHQTALSIILRELYDTAQQCRFNRFLGGPLMTQDLREYSDVEFGHLVLIKSRPETQSAWSGIELYAAILDQSHHC